MGFQRVKLGNDYQEAPLSGSRGDLDRPRGVLDRLTNLDRHRKSTAATKPKFSNADLKALPSLSSRQHISATGLLTDPSASSDLFPDDESTIEPKQPTRPPSFVPRISIPIEELLARQARARALHEWSDLEINLNITPPHSLRIPQFTPDISKYAPSPVLPPEIPSNIYGIRDIYPPSDALEDETFDWESKERPTRHLQLRNIGTTPLPSDVYRLIPNKIHIPRWRNAEASFAAFWGRDPRTLTKEGGYHLVWPEGSFGKLSKAGMGAEESSKKRAGRGQGEKRAAAFRRHFAGAVREADRFPAAVVGKLNITSDEESNPPPTEPPQNTTASEDMTQPGPDRFLVPAQKPKRLLRPHQTIPLPHPHPIPSANFLPPAPLLHGSLLYLHFLTSCRPPCPPGSAVLLTTSSQGGPTPSSGKVPRTREILERLMDEDFELLGSIKDDSSAGGNWQKQEEEEEEPDASSIGGSRSLDILSDHLSGYREGRVATESLYSGANEEKYGVTRFVFTKREDEEAEEAFSAVHFGSADTGGLSKKQLALSKRQRKESGRKAAEKRGIEGAEGRWVVRLSTRTEAARMVRAWHMREFWTGIGGERAAKVVMRAEIL